MFYKIMKMCNFAIIIISLSKRTRYHLNIKKHEEIFPFNLYSHDGLRLRRL